MPKKITEADVRHVAQLSRLKLSDEQIAFFTGQLADVLGYIDKLSELDVEGVAPMPHPTNMTNKLRADDPTPGMPVDQALANAAGVGPAILPRAQGTGRRGRGMSIPSMNTPGDRAGDRRQATVRRRGHPNLPRPHRATRRHDQRVQRDLRRSRHSNAPRRSTPGEVTGPLAGVPIAIKDNPVYDVGPHDVLLEDPQRLPRPVHRDGCGETRSRRRGHPWQDETSMNSRWGRPPRTADSHRRAIPGQPITCPAGRRAGRPQPRQPTCALRPSGRTPAGPSANPPRCAAWWASNPRTGWSRGSA